MKMFELQKNYINKRGWDKNFFLQFMRENYMHYLPEIQEVLSNNEECNSIVIGKDGCVLEKRDGVKLYFDFTQAICRAEVEFLLFGDPEKDDMRLINEFLTQEEDGIIFDIGANVGVFSLTLYQNNRNYDYYLFEPVPATYEWLKRTEKLNKVDTDHYRSFNVGMSNKKGLVNFFVPASNEAASIVANEDGFYRKRSNIMGEYTGKTEIDKILCNVTTVDDFVLENNIASMTFMKIDVEGNEKAVLEGAKNSLTKFEPLVYAELLRKHAKRFGYHPNDVINFMKSLGYDCAVQREGKLELIKYIDEETVETNFFFLKVYKHGDFFDKFTTLGLG